MNFRSHHRDHGHGLRRRHRHLGSHLHHHLGKDGDSGRRNRHRRGASCHRTGCYCSATIAGRHGAAGYGRPGIRHHHHRSEATTGDEAGAGARVAAIERHLGSPGWAALRTGSGADSGFLATGSVAVRRSDCED